MVLAAWKKSIILGMRLFLFTNSICEKYLMNFYWMFLTANWIKHQLSQQNQQFNILLGKKRGEWNEGQRESDGMVEDGGGISAYGGAWEGRLRYGVNSGKQKK